MKRDKRSQANHRQRRIIVRGVRREPVDVRKLSRALLALAQAQAEADAEAQAKSAKTERAS